MKKIYRNINLLVGAALISTSLNSCIHNPDSPGLEYMPDMYRSQAIETYVDYGLVGETENDSLKNRISALHPPKGTIKFAKNPSKAAYNFPFEYANTTEGRDSARAYLKNPIPYSETVATEGEELFLNFCSQCHGDTGEGDGGVVEWGNFPSPGAYKTKDMNEGTIFHTITYGKGLMGAHGSLLSKEERWKVVHHILKLKNGGEYPSKEVKSDVKEENK